MVKNMKYDPEDKKFYFSTQMIPSQEDSDASFEHFKAYQQMCLDNPGAWARSMVQSDDEEQSAGMTIAGIVIGIALLGGILGTILCLPIQKYEYIPWIMSTVMFVLGVFFIFGAKLKGSKVFVESVLWQRIEGVIGVLGAIGLIAVNFLFPKDVTALFVMAVFCEITFVLFLVMTVKLIGFAMTPKNIYKEEVKAKCIGYVRTYETDNQADTLPMYTTLSSPVFEYHYGGSKYQSYYDVLDAGKDGKISVGSEQVIRISPEDPTHILGNLKRHMDTPLCFALLSLAATIVLLVLILR